jgi:hypothetical protein
MWLSLFYVRGKRTSVLFLFLELFQKIKDTRKSERHRVGSSMPFWFQQVVLLKRKHFDMLMVPHIVALVNSFLSKAPRKMEVLMHGRIIIIKRKNSEARESNKAI